MTAYTPTQLQSGLTRAPLEPATATIDTLARDIADGLSRIIDRQRREDAPVVRDAAKLLRVLANAKGCGVGAGR